MLEKIKRWLMLGEDTIFPEVDSRILIGSTAVVAATQMLQNRLLLTYPLNLAPAHADCVRIIFARGAALNAIYGIAFNNQAGLVYDSILKYGTEGTPIIPDVNDGTQSKK